MSNSNIVSFENERLILVDDDDNILGYKSKAECHNGKGILHRAFSIFIFNSKTELLLQQRTADKRLWPMYWSNSCCSHPREGEEYDFAVNRRLKEELGLETKLQKLYKFKYHAVFEDKGSEYELCSVYIGKTDDSPVVNPTEIADWKVIPPDELTRELKNNPAMYTPWFKMEWKELTSKYWGEIIAF